MNQLPTLKEVARRAGVSISTASLVLNEHPSARIAAGTRRKVLQAARELRYGTHRPGRRLRLHFLAGGGARKPSTYEQLAAFAAAQREAGRHGARLQVTVTGKSAQEQVSCLDALEPWLASLRRAPAQNRPTAILADKERIGRRVLRRLRSMEYRTPEELSLVVFDDPCVDEPDHPPVTCVRRPVEAISRLAVSRLLEELDAPDLPRVGVVLPVELVIRESSGPAPHAAPEASPHG